MAQASSEGDGGARPAEVAYLVSQYPAPSHVFVEREIEGLRALGVRVDTFSVRPVPTEALLSRVMREEAARTTVLLTDRRAVAAAVARLTRAHPLASLRGIGRAARTGPRYARHRLWQLFYWAEAVRLHDELDRRGLRHLHVHFSNNSADIARLVVEIGRAVDGPGAGWRWSMTVHGPTEFERVEAADLAAKVLDAAGVACISDFTRSQLMRLVPPEVWPRLDLVRMSVDVDRYQPVERPVVPVGAGRPLRILNVGRLVPEKGAPVLLDALAQLVADGVPVEARLVGGGELAGSLAEQVDDLGLAGSVTLTGPVGQEQLPELYRWADVFVLPSFQEGLPVVLMEAMASGLPVVTTAIAGIPELVTDRVSGRVLPAGRADAVAEALRELALDPALGVSWGTAGREKVVAEFAVAVAARAQRDFLAGVAEH